MKQIMDSQIKLDFTENAISPELKQYKDVFARELYKLLAHRFYSEPELELELSLDIVDVIWQIPYDNLSEKLRSKYDSFIDAYVSRIVKGNDEFLLLFGQTDPNANIESINKIRECYNILSGANKEPELKLDEIVIQQAKIISKLMANKPLTKKDRGVLDKIEKIVKDVQN